jgi:RecA-family ATPase
MSGIEDLLDPEPGNIGPLPYVDLAAALIERRWLVVDRIPMLNVTSLAGEGAVGKSIALLQLSAAVVLGKDWFGSVPEVGSVIYVAAEEDADEIRRRLEAIAKHYGATRQTLIDAGLRVLSFAGRDAILGAPDRQGIIKPTPLFERIKHDAVELKPKLIVIDPVADAFAGNEIDRAQTRQYITIVRGLAIDACSAVVMATHPSLTGITSGSGLSGSTAWHNSVRARMYFKATADANDDDVSAMLRILEVKKNNYGPVSEAITVRWQDGVYVVVDPEQGSLDLSTVHSAVDRLFLTLLRRLAEQKRFVSDKRSPSYAPTVFARQPEASAAKTDVAGFAAGMERLFASGKIAVEEEGPPSRRYRRLVEVPDTPSNGPSNTPSNGVRTPSNDLSTHTPLYPHARSKGQGGVRSPAPPNGPSEGIPRAREPDVPVEELDALQEMIRDAQSALGEEDGDA